MGVSWSQRSPEYKDRYYAAKREARKRGEGRQIEVEHPLDFSKTAQEIIEDRVKDFQRKIDHEESRKLIHARVKIPGPYGILHLGDPHLDDDGCDWIALKRDVELVKRTPALFAANVGDTTNNWVGRLSHLFGQQKTTAKEALILAKWFFRELKDSWLYIIQGNHDAWSGEGDPLDVIAESIGALYESSEARIEVSCPKGSSIIINARHDFAGGSMYNPAHGPGKAALLGIRDNILICGHKHKSGYSPLKDPATGLISHCIQVASYKFYDRYAREKGFRDQSLGPCCITIVDPESETATGLVQVFWDSDLAVDYLGFLRNRRGYK